MVDRFAGEVRNPRHVHAVGDHFNSAGRQSEDFAEVAGKLAGRRHDTVHRAVLHASERAQRFSPKRRFRSKPRHCLPGP